PPSPASPGLTSSSSTPSIDPPLRVRLSAEIHRQLLRWPPLVQASRVHCYASFGTEVETLALIGQLIEMGKMVFSSRWEKDRLVHAPVLSVDGLRISPSGIPEPQAEALENPDCDLILIPGLAFDRHGNRIGYGRGLYDRFLSRARGLRVGLCFSDQIVDELPFGEHDEAMHFLCSEAGPLQTPPQLKGQDWNSSRDNTGTW
ncbi:MAG: 5-formyltetrahydrofolate cyclo-ligase, partial [Planctomycetes bacterium]|nr:5-formyltetrahydrofolate cyclo-ligase [Planctomycetota bacterium]